MITEVEVANRNLCLLVCGDLRALPVIVASLGLLAAHERSRLVAMNDVAVIAVVEVVYPLPAIARVLGGIEHVDIA